MSVTESLREIGRLIKNLEVKMSKREEQVRQAMQDYEFTLNSGKHLIVTEVVRYEPPSESDRPHEMGKVSAGYVEVKANDGNLYTIWEDGRVWDDNDMERGQTCGF